MGQWDVWAGILVPGWYFRFRRRQEYLSRLQPGNKHSTLFYANAEGFFAVRNRALLYASDGQCVSGNRNQQQRST